MRLFELTEINRTPVATTRFVADLEKLMDHNKSAAEILSGFIESKLKSNDRYGKKDDKFKNGYISSFWHWHLVFGKIIVVYQLTSSELRLATIVSHKMIDGPPPVPWTRWLNDLGPADYHPFEIPNDEVIHELTDDERDDIIKLFWEMAVNKDDRPYLESAVKGQWEKDMSDFMLQLVAQPIGDDKKWEAILRAFNGEQGIAQRIQDILNNTR